MTTPATASVQPAWGHRPLSTLVAAIAVSTGGMLPVMLIGALAVQLREDLSLTNTGIGIAVSGFFLASAGGSVSAGQWTDRLGTRPSLLAAAVSSALCLATIAALATSLPLLFLILLIGTVAAALSTPATNALVVANLPAARQGLAHGAKQAAIPLSGMLAGLAVPTLALTVGWRWAFAAAVLVPAAGGWASVAAAPRREPRHHVRARPPDRVKDLHPLERRALLTLAVGTGFSAAAVTSLNSFMVVACTDAGMSEAWAGTVAAIASSVVIVVRLVAGHVADRARGDRLLPVAVMLSCSFVGYLLLATNQPPVMAVGAVIGLAAGWGWPGLATLAVVELHPDRPGVATGVVMTGIYLGAVLGPLAIAGVEGWTSFPFAWIMCGALAQAAATFVLLGRRRYGQMRSGGPGTSENAPVGFDPPGGTQRR